MSTKRNGSSKRNNANVIRRDRGICQYCFDPGDTIDHIIPISANGHNGTHNKVCCCLDCNQIAGDKAFDSFAIKKAYILRVKSERATI